MRNYLNSFVLAFGIATAGAAVGYSIYCFKAFDRYVSVKGLVEKTVKANQAVWTIGVNAADDSLLTVYQSINNAQAKIKSFLQEAGFQEQEVQLSPINVTDNQSLNYSSNPNSKRYTAKANVVLTTPNVDNVAAKQQTISDLVQQGVVLNDSKINYVFTNLNNVKPEMLDAATANAKLAAEAFARNSHSALGGIRNASQGQFSISNADGSSVGPYAENSSVMKVIRVVTSVDYFLK